MAAGTGPGRDGSLGIMQFFEFTVDRDLRITTCGGQLEKGPIRSTQELLNRPYFEVLPRLFHRDEDAIAAVVASGSSLHLPHYSFGCLHDEMKADVRIEPLYRKEDRQTTGARVSIQVAQGCSFMNHVEMCQQLIDIGKNASILAHGVRNPLNAIKGAVVYLKNRYGDEAPLLEFTTIMEEEIARLEKFITSFLSSSFDNFERDTVQITEVLRWVELFTSLQAQTAGVRIGFRPSGKGTVRVNRFQIEQALLNVINNAITAMPQGGEIVVESRSFHRNGQHFALIEVSDSGPGMNRPRSHKPLGPRPETGAAGGKGFGLFITEEVMRRHGGVWRSTVRPNAEPPFDYFCPWQGRIDTWHHSHNRTVGGFWSSTTSPTRLRFFRLS